MMAERLGEGPLFLGAELTLVAPSCFSFRGLSLPAASLFLLFSFFSSCEASMSCSDL